MILNISEATLALGYQPTSRSTLQRLVKRGDLDAYRVVGRGRGREVLLETDPPGLPSLREAVQTLTQYRPDSPLWQRQRQRQREPLAELSDAELGAYTDRVMAGLDAMPTPDWEAIATVANGYLDCSAWGPPPWPADRWSTLRVVLELAQEAADG